jgi:hypothetical protein
MPLNVVFCCLCAERMRISPGHAGGGPDDWPVLCAGAALVCADHKAKILLNVVFCCLCAERMRMSPGHACGWPDNQPVLCAGAALVCGHHTAKMPLNVVFVACVQNGAGYRLDMLVVSLP